MIKQHWSVTLIDLLEALPFVARESDIVRDIINTDDQNYSIKPLIKFIELLENVFGDEVAYIGEEANAERYYTRFLFRNGGFLEIMMQAPAAVVAHFIEKERAEKFVTTLKKVLDRTIEDKTICQLLKDSIELSPGTDEALTYEKWSEMKNIREMMGEK